MIALQFAAEDGITAEAIKLYRQQLGKPYDVKAIIAFALPRDWRDPRAWFCSELIAAALEQCGFFPNRLSSPANEVTPRDLMFAVSPWSQSP